MRDVFDHTSERRAEAIRSLGIMDSEDEADFDEITSYAAEICEAPISLVTLVNDERQWAKSAFGTQQRDYTMDESICAHGLSGPDFLEIEDTAADPRTRDNPLVTGPDPIRYYGGAILKLGDTTPIGALCILDRKPRRLSDATKRLLIILARQVTRRMELRRALAAQETLASEVDHRVKNSLQMVTALVRIQRAQARSDETREALSETIDRLSAISLLHAELHKVSARNEIALHQFLPDIIRHLETTLPPNVAIRHRLVPLMVRSEVAASLALLLNEAVANAAKHAFPEGRDGRIDVALELAGGEARLSVVDDGVGSDRLEAAPERGSGLGRQIIDASVARVNGEIFRRSGAEGTRIEIRFPAPRLLPDA
ncbi:sensor histidine kinase [Limimaricola hongkongensis]|uniref:GAF domain protein n=1 Tax=Limimaricola hongkongensis DSM 17492 TaxID=1122180 RepID=A0A017HHH5_9RHOB|nr:histidine kinase dimerization/phosphoacceptor domain -containing protein [Limimaricola hongkongensis]EYD73775.1 GAF domain protein [Limimaricola hongkongensis DSM 17492]